MMDDAKKKEALAKELSDVVNKHGVDNYSGTPDWVLANMLVDFLESYGTWVRVRDQMVEGSIPEKEDFIRRIGPPTLEKS